MLKQLSSSQVGTWAANEYMSWMLRKVFCSFLIATNVTTMKVKQLAGMLWGFRSQTSSNKQN
jgi:hypothetical protein